MRRIGPGLTALVATIVAPGAVAAHGLVGRYESPLPLAVYLTGAAIAVALSFALVLLRDVRAVPAKSGAPRIVPKSVRIGLRAIGLLAWLWIVAQTMAGNGGDADVASLFLWIYGWVGLALISALWFPIWQWLDPFATLHDLGAALLRRLGVQPWEAAPYPPRLAQWPAVAAFAFFIWIELVALFGVAGRPAGLLLITYTALTLVFMAQFGRDAWRTNGETFSVWFATLGRLAPFGLAKVGPSDSSDAVVRRPFASGLLDQDWSWSRLALVALGTGSIIFDGLSQTEAFFGAFGVPSLLTGTSLLVAFLGTLVLLVFAVAWVSGRVAIGAGLVPIAVGYLVAHYLTFLLGDGQRIIVAISDPFLQGWDLFGTAFYEPSTDWIPPSLLWTIILAAVVGGHMLGAWSGHVATAGRSNSDRRLRQVPLAILMVALTVTTLWSLGQRVVGTEPAASRLTPREQRPCASGGVALTRRPFAASAKPTSEDPGRPHAGQRRFCARAGRSALGVGCRKRLRQRLIERRLGGF